MSRMEHNKGILRPTGIDTEHWTEENYEDAYSNGLVEIHGEMYTVEWEKRGEDIYGFNNTVVDADGVIYFDTYHYNGGGHWTELVEEKVV